MSYENAAAEVAEDFKTALEDMTSISRIEIMNLCQIARENTEHAFEISEVLVAHINRVCMIISLLFPPPPLPLPFFPFLFTSCRALAVRYSDPYFASDSNGKGKTQTNCGSHLRIRQVRAQDLMC